jgi:hypothetical protein
MTHPWRTQCTTTFHPPKELNDLDYYIEQETQHNAEAHIHTHQISEQPLSLQQLSPSLRTRR